MPGPEPAANRRRRNIPVKELNRIILPPEGRKGAIPKPRTDVRLDPEERAQWRAWWRSPMATQWRLEDAYPLTRLLMLYRDDRVLGVDTKRSAEMRQLEARFGLEPRSRKELCWVIGEPDAPVAAPVEAPDEVAQRRERVKAKRAG